MQSYLLRGSRPHLLFQLVVLSCFFFPPLGLKALPPEMALPSDPDFVGANESFDGLGWARLALMPTPRIDFAMSALNGKIYAAGGRAFTITGPITTLEEYNPGTDSWATKAPMPTARFNTGAGTVADGMPNARMYVVGGLRSNLTITGRVDAYNSTSNAWTSKTPMSVPRWGVSCGVTGGLLYAIGGVDSTGVVGTVEAYDPSVGLGGTWTLKASMSVARRNAVVGVVGGKIYAIGGVNDDIDPNTGLTDVEVYNPRTDTWTPQMSMPKPQLGAAGGVIAGKIYVTGGIEGDVTQTALSVVQVYDPVTDSWDEVAPMPTARLNHRTAVVSGVLYAIGGRFFGVARIDQPFLYKIVATNNPTSYDASPLPPGLSVDTTRGLIYGIPTGTPSESTVTLSASNVDGTATQDINFKVLPSIPSASLPAAESSPAVISSKSATGRLGDPFSFQVLLENATDSTVLDAGGLPPGLTLDPVTGVISGTVPSSADEDSDGLVTNHVALQLDLGVTGSQDDLELVFTSDDATPVITSPEVVTLVPNQCFSYTMTADRSATFHYRTADGVLDGDLPDGLCFDGTDIISGIYTPGRSAVCAGKAHARVRTRSFRDLSKVFHAPDTLKIRPPIEIINLLGDSTGHSTHPLDFFEPTAVSVLSHGTSGDFSISLPLEGDPGAPGVECRNGDTGERYHVVVTFPTPISETWDVRNVTIEGAASRDGLPTISTDRTEVTVNLKNATDQQIVTIQLSGIGVDNDARSYDVRVPLGLLIADTNRDGFVIKSDDQPGPEDFGPITPETFQYDLNRDSVVSNADNNLVKNFARAHHHLPTPTPTVTPTPTPCTAASVRRKTPAQPGL